MRNMGWILQGRSMLRPYTPIFLCGLAPWRGESFRFRVRIYSRKTQGAKVKLSSNNDGWQSFIQ